ncbi:MAG: helix-turn-helix domain-containing protein [Thermomicrobiales bacterium]
MADVTLLDLIAWEPRLALAQLNGASGSALENQHERSLERELSWAVMAKATVPMLPLLRGGELVILPSRVLGDSGLSLPILLRELSAHDVAGVVVDTPLMVGHASVPLVMADPIPADFENELNRLLTQRRSELYRAGTDLSRMLSNLNAAGASIDDILTAASNSLGVPSAVTDVRGALIAATDSDAVPGTTAGHRGWRGERLAIPMASGETLWLGPVPKARRALCRVAGERIAVAAETALVRAAQLRPRGPARAAALASLLGGTQSDTARAAASAGLPLDAVYRVAFASPDVDPSSVQRLLAPLGTLHDAGQIDKLSAFIIEARSESLPVFSPSALGAVFGAQRSGDGRGWLAISSSGGTAAGLPELSREARYTGELLQKRLIEGPIARFDAINDLGPYRLLFRLWGTNELERFSSEALGELVANDRRGALRETLLTFLECGGSHVDAAKQLNIHRNTLAYRLKQIADATQRDPAEPSARLTLHLALLGSMLPPAPV